MPLEDIAGSTPARGTTLVNPDDLTISGRWDMATS